ncbi:MAG: hypothetical protein JSW46_03175 [Gemmatimonadota bacterium]|nr:MAG: hypothetical protein JSW46_03175 [Gemmatimonadota bacterium]
MKRIHLIGAAIVMVILIVLFVYPGRGSRPDYPLVYHYQSESDPYANVSTAACQQDLDVYVRLIDEVHGDPYSFVPEEAFRAKAAEMKARVAAMGVDSIQLVDCYFYLQELAAVMQDEHTDISILSGWWDAMPSAFPIRVKIVDGVFYAAEDLSGSGIPSYAELVSIDEVPLSAVLAEIMPYQNNTLHHYKLQAIEEEFHFWLQARSRLEAPWDVEYVSDGELRSVRVEGIDRQEFRERTEHEEGYSAYSLDVEGVTVPVLDIPRFWYPDKAGYQSFMDSFFIAHAEDPYLVIDARRNPGGDGRWGFYVLDYLTDAEYETMKRFTHRVSEPYKAVRRYYIRDEYYRRGIPLVLSFPPVYRWLGDYGWRKEAEEILSADVGTYLELGGDPWDRDEGKRTFEGETFLLTSHYTNSAAVVFAAAFKYNKMGTIVGRETGGRESFMSDPIFIELPGTTLRAKIPVAILELVGDNPSRGVLPDVEVEYLIEDYVAGRDRDLDAVRDLVLFSLQGRTGGPGGV